MRTIIITINILLLSLILYNFLSKGDELIENLENCDAENSKQNALTAKINNQFNILDRIKKISGNDIEKHIIYKRSFCVSDFKETYNSFGGNAYGLANTLMQTAFLRPKLQSKKVKKLYFSGQLTVPGPGVPPAIVSGKLVSDIIINNERTF